MKPNILLVDDEENFHQFFSFAFSKLYNITFVSTIGLAKEMIKEYKFDLIITDLNLTPSHQDLTGLDLIELIKKDFPKVPCVAITSVKRIYLPDKAFFIGADCYLQKGNFDLLSWKQTFENLLISKQ